VQRLRSASWIAGGALVVGAVFRHGFLNYDTAYAVAWGEQVWRGETPSYDVPVAPTPHPLANLVGLLVAPLGDRAAELLLVGFAFAMLGALGLVVYRLGSLWFGWAAGALAAVIVLTREPVLSFGVRVYVDIPYLVLVLGAVLVEARRRRAGAPVLVLLGVAGLLRPEAWLFSLLYLAWLAPGTSDRRELARLTALAVAAPVLWALSDLIVTGNPFWSLTQTRDTGEALGRATGLDDVPSVMPRRLGEILREPVLVGAAGGGLLVLAWMRERARVAVAVGFASIAAFCVLAAAGLPIITRYLLLPSAILAIFCGAGAFGWTRLASGDPRRRRWQAFGALTVVLLLAFVPSQAHRLDGLQGSIATQARISHDLYRLTRDARPPVFARACGPVSVPNHRLVPLLADWLELAPERIQSAQLVSPRAGTYVDPATPAVAKDFILDPHDPRRLSATVPPGFRPAQGNRSWRAWVRCTS
jgi:hypothetical protein